MANISQATLDAEKVECPSCKRQPNHQCVSRVTGYVTALHPARIRAGALTAERARIRRELLAGLPEPEDLSLNEVRDLIDRIAPEEG